MASISADSIALLPIKPKYANAIKSGLKKIEFRKRPFARDIDYVIVYSSSPEKKIIGYFEIENIEIDTPSNLWDRFHNIGSISYKEFQNYYRNSEQAVGFLIRQFIPLVEPIKLSELQKNLKAPQSYCYLDTKYLYALIEKNSCKIMN